MSENERLDSVIKLAKRCGIMILENGGETYRAEETVLSVCHTCGYKEVSVMAMPTGFFFSIATDGITESSVARISCRCVNLKLLNGVNEVSHELSDGKIDVKAALRKIDDLKNEKKPNILIPSVGSAICSSAFCGLFGGGPLEMLIALSAGFLLQIASGSVSIFGTYSFFMSLFGGAVVALLAVIPGLFIDGLLISSIIIGAIMPLVPGLALTNAIRDILSGDLISGVTRLTEALLIAVCIAVGSGVVLYLYSAAGGVLL